MHFHQASSDTVQFYVAGPAGLMPNIHGIPPYKNVTGIKCRLCSGIYTTETALADHVTKCMRKNCVCNICGKRYFKNQDLKLHHKKVHGDGPMN